MKFQLFQYPLPAPPELPDLNAFLDKNRVASVTHHLTQAPGGPLLVFVVQTAGAAAPAGKSDSRIDYRAVLDPDSFALYSRLRDERKVIAKEENLPIYAVFTNAQLAQIVQSGVAVPQDLARIAGIGRARIDKWG